MDAANNASLVQRVVLCPHPQPNNLQHYIAETQRNTRHIRCERACGKPSVPGPVAWDQPSLHIYSCIRNIPLKTFLLPPTPRGPRRRCFCPVFAFGPRGVAGGRRSVSTHPQHVSIIQASFHPLSHMFSPHSLFGLQSFWGEIFLVKRRLVPLHTERAPCPGQHPWIRVVSLATRTRSKGN